MRELTVLEAVREALFEEMRRDERVIVLGEDVGRLGGVFRATDGLLDEFGPERVVDTPMAELSIAGMAVGLAMRGLRPVAEIQFADFIHAAADHLIGEAAKIRYRTAGDWTCPLVVRTAWGGGFRGGPYHSQSVEAFYCHVPGLKVVAPSFAADAKGLLTASIRDPDPVLFLEHKMTYRGVRGPVPEGEHVEDLGRARVVREGDAVTICAWGLMLHEDTRTMGLGAEIAARVAEAALDDLQAPPLRVTMPDVGGIPVSDPMEDALLPGADEIVDGVRRLAGHRSRRAASAPAPAFDAQIPQASSVVEVDLDGRGLPDVLDAVASACRDHPSCNATFTWAGITYHDDVGIDVDLGPHSPAPGTGTFTVVDYGPAGSHLALPAVRPGQTAALRVGAPRDGRAWLALSVDHRAVDGAEAGRFLARVKERLERRAQEAG